MVNKHLKAFQVYTSLVQFPNMKGAINDNSHSNAALSPLFCVRMWSSPPTNNSHQIIQPVKIPPQYHNQLRLKPPLYLRQYIEQHDWKAAFVYIDNAYLVNEDTGKRAEFLAAYPEIALTAAPIFKGDLHVKHQLAFIQEDQKH